jgi:hypothetical protein
MSKAAGPAGAAPALKRWSVLGNGFAEIVKAEHYRVEQGALWFTAGGHTVAMFASGHWVRFDLIRGRGR